MGTSSHLIYSHEDKTKQSIFKFFEFIKIIIMNYLEKHLGTWKQIILYSYFIVGSIVLFIINFKNHNIVTNSSMVVILTISSFFISIYFLINPFLDASNFNKFGITPRQIFLNLCKKYIVFYAPNFFVCCLFVIINPVSILSILSTVILILLYFIVVTLIFIPINIIELRIPVFKVFHRLLLSMGIAFFAAAMFFPNLRIIKNGTLSFDFPLVDYLISQQYFFTLIILGIFAIFLYHISKRLVFSASRQYKDNG
jgi:hypothetical protein